MQFREWLCDESRMIRCRKNPTSPAPDSIHGAITLELSIEGPEAAFQYEVVNSAGENLAFQPTLAWVLDIEQEFSDSHPDWLSVRDNWLIVKPSQIPHAGKWQILLLGGRFVSRTVDLTVQEPRRTGDWARALARYRANDDKGACVAFDAVARKHPENGAIWADLAACEARQGRRTKAIEAARKGIRFGPRFVRLNAYRTLFQAGLTLDVSHGPKAVPSSPGLGCRTSVWLDAVDRGWDSSYVVHDCKAGRCSGGERDAVVEFVASQSLRSRNGTVELSACRVVAVDACRRRIGFFCEGDVQDGVSGPNEVSW
jgi:hypothetical protein